MFLPNEVVWSIRERMVSVPGVMRCRALILSARITVSADQDRQAKQMKVYTAKSMSEKCFLSKMRPFKICFLRDGRLCVWGEDCA